MSTTPAEPVKVGVAGLGRFGRLHALTLSGLAEANLVALVARRQESLDAVATELPGVPGWLNLEQAIEESAADAWVVAATTGQHVPITKLLLEAGKTVLLEKPISENLAEAESLQPLVKADSSNLMLGHIVLFNSEYLALRDEVATRGPITYIDCVRHRPAADFVKHAGENPLQLTMVHDLYIVQALLDCREPTHFTSQMHRADDGNVDLALAQLQWEDGTLASFAASFLTPAGMAPRGFDRMEVFGKGWLARLLSNPRPIEVWGEKASWPMPLEIRADKTGPTGMMAEELRCFCRVAQGLQKIPSGATFTDALQVQKWMDRLESSSKQNG